jgi:hypothetical protein
MSLDKAISPGRCNKTPNSVMCYHSNAEEKYENEILHFSIQMDFLADKQHMPLNGAY